MMFRLAARLEFVALSALGAALMGGIAGCGSGTATLSPRATIADTQIPADRILAIAETFEQQGNLEKAQELYCYVQNSCPELRDDLKIRTRNLAQRMDEEDQAACQPQVATKATPPVRQKAPAQAALPPRNVPPMRREVVRKATTGTPPRVQRGLDRPAVETWATLRMRVNERNERQDARNQPSQSSRRIHAQPAVLEQSPVLQDSIDPDADGWKASDFKSIQNVASDNDTTEEVTTPWDRDSRRESADEGDRPSEDKFVGLLQSQDPNVRRAAAQHISQMGPQATDLLRPLRDTLQREESRETRLQLAEAILRVSPREVEAFRVLLKAAADKNGETAAIARVMLSAHLVRNPALVESQAQLLLKDNDNDVRSAARWNLNVASRMRMEREPEVRYAGATAEESRVQPALSIRPASRSKSSALKQEPRQVE